MFDGFDMCAMVFYNCSSFVVSLAIVVVGKSNSGGGLMYPRIKGCEPGFGAISSRFGS